MTARLRFARNDDIAPLIPAQAGIQQDEFWAPAFAGASGRDPKNQAHGASFQKNRAAPNALFHRQKFKAFDFAAAMTITAWSRSTLRDVTGDAD